MGACCFTGQQITGNNQWSHKSTGIESLDSDNVMKALDFM